MRALKNSPKRLTDDGLQLTPEGQGTVAKAFAIETGLSDVAKAASTLAPISAPRSQNPNVKRQWLQENLDREMPVQPDMISVVGGAAGYLDDGRKISRADLQDREGVLRLYVVQAADHLEGPIRRLRAFHVIRRSSRPPVRLLKAARVNSISDSTRTPATFS